MADTSRITLVLLSQAVDRSPTALIHLKYNILVLVLVHALYVEVHFEFYS